MFTRAIVRPPAPNFAEGLTTVSLGAPDYQRAIEQHEAYCSALESCGLALTRWAADPEYPDSTFVEDVGVLTDRCAILTRPGAPTRLGEIEGIRPVFAQFFRSFEIIQPPGTLDGGDVCQAGEHFFIGISERTNEAGAQQLAAFLAANGYTTNLIDIRQMAPAALLHLKSGLAYLHDDRLAITDALAGCPEFANYDHVRVSTPNQYAANCIRVNDYLLIAAGYPQFETDLQRLGYQTIALQMSEFQKMDGGLSCLSLRF